jgi:hypothetical protein
MSQATATHTTNRRALLAGLATAPLAPAPSWAATSNPDARLLDLFAKWSPIADEANRTVARRWQLEDAGGEPLEVDALEAREQELIALAEPLREKIAQVPARTLPGLIAKARVASDSNGGIEPDELDGTNVGLALALVRDLIELQGARA